MMPTNTPAEPPDAPTPEETGEAPQSDLPPAVQHMKSVSALLRERFGLGR